MQPTPALTPRRALKDEQTIQPTLSRLAEALIEHIHHLLEAGRFDDALDLFNDLDPADQGDIFADLGDEDRERLLAALSPEDSAQIVAQLEPEEAVDMFGEVETTALSGILDEARPDIAADVLRQLPDEQTQETLEAMRDVEDVLPLLEHPDDSAGGLMTPDFLSVRQDIAAGSALDSIRIRGPEAADVGWVFVLDGDGRLTGGLGVVKLALSSSPSEDYLAVLAGQRQWIATTNFAGCPSRPPDSFANSAVLTTSAKFLMRWAGPSARAFLCRLAPKRNSLSRLWPVQISDHSPFTFFQSPQQELPESPALLDLSEYRLHSLHPQSVALPTPPGL